MYENRGLISDWDILRLILAIDRYGGVAGAARFLGVTHATVSRRLARAESDAGHFFFERLPAGLRLTEIGRSVVEYATRVEPEFNALERQLVRHEKGLGGPLRVTMPALMATDAVSRDIADFANKHPEIQLEFVGDSNLLNLHRREADVAIRVTRKPPETLWGRKVTEQHAGFYAQRDWFEKSAVKQNSVYKDLPLISFTSWKREIPDLVRQLCPDARVVASCDDMVMAIQMVKAGFGVTRMPRILGDAMADLVRIEELPWEPYFPIWLLTHPDLRKVPRIEAFMHHMAACFVRRRHLYCAIEEK